MKFPVYLWALWACVGEQAQAQNAPLPVLNVPRALSTPRLNASPSDAAWASAATISALTLSRGEELSSNVPPTRVKLMWDENFLYARFECGDTRIYAPFVKPDRDQPLYQGDVVELFLDVVGDGRQYVELQISPRNQVFDQNIVLSTAPVSDENGRLVDAILKRDFWPDSSWNMKGLQTAASTRPRGWTADVAVPAAPLLRRLGLKTFAPMTLRAHLMRYKWIPTGDPKTPRRLIPMNWAPVQSGTPHISPQAMGFLKLVR